MLLDHPFRANALRAITSEGTSAALGIPARLSHGLTAGSHSRTLENRPLYFQSFAHCPLSLTSKFALCFDTLAHCSSRNSPEMIIIHHCPMLFLHSWVMFHFNFRDACPPDFPNRHPKIGINKP